MTDSLRNLAQQLDRFARDRDWQQFHSPKNLASALVVEAGELLEHFQWLTEEQSRALAPEKRELNRPGCRVLPSAAAWEQCAIDTGYRYLHPHFCLVADFLVGYEEKDEAQHTLGTGMRRYRWRDGWEV